MGKSKPWPYALEKLTGSREMSVAPLKEYFEPLQKWLVNERCSKKYKIGWPGQPADGVKNCSTTMKPTKMNPTTSTTSGQIVHTTGTFCLFVTVISLVQLLAWL